MRKTAAPTAEHSPSPTMSKVDLMLQILLSLPMTELETVLESMPTETKLVIIRRLQKYASLTLSLYAFK